MLKDKFTSGLPIKLRGKVKFKTFSTFEDLIKTATKYDVAIQEIEGEKRQIEIVFHVAGYSRPEQKTDPEVTDAIKSLQEQTNMDIPLGSAELLLQLRNKLDHVTIASDWDTSVVSRGRQGRE